jgi:hypothetical protein
MMTGSETLFACPQVGVIASRNLALAVWRDTPTIEVLREVTRAGRALAKQQPNGSGLVNLFVSGTPRFSEEVRAEVVKIARDPTLYPLGIARVFLLPGLAGVAVRAFLNTVTLVAGPSSRPLRAFTTLEEAAAWLAPKLEVGGLRWTPAQILTITSAYLEAGEKAG